MSYPYTSPQNAKAERILCTINNMLRSLLFQASILARYWVEGFHTTTYLLNRLPTKAVSTTSPYFALHGIAPSYEHLHMFSCACYPNLSAKAAHKLAPRCTIYIFLGYSTDHKGYRCLDLTNNNIIISRHIVFDEADFPFSTSLHLTNDLDTFLQDDSPGAAPMPAPLPAPCVLPGFSPLVAAGGPTARTCSLTEPKTEAGNQIASPGDQTTLRTEAEDQTTPHTEAGGQTTTLGSPTARTCAAPSSPTSPSLATPRVAPTTWAAPHAVPLTPLAPHAAPASTTMTTPPATATGTASTSGIATGEGRAGSTSGQFSSDDHVGEAGLPVDKLTLSATSAPTLSLVPSFVPVALTDGNWHLIMEEGFAALITNDTWDLVSHPIGSSIIIDKWILKHKFNSFGSLDQYKAC
jgi:hypothetical protein